MVWVLFTTSYAHAGPTTVDCLAARENALALTARNELRAARSQLLVCSFPSCPADLRDECLRGSDELDVAIPTLVWEIQNDAGGPVAPVVVRMDGELLTRHGAGLPMSIDPGQHTFTFESPDHAFARQQVAVIAGEKDRTLRVVLNIRETRPNAPPPVALDASVGDAPPPRRSGVDAGSFAALGIGVGALTLGVGFGLTALSRRNAAEAACPSRECADQSGVALWSQAQMAGRIATVAFVVAGVGLAAAATLRW